MTASADQINTTGAGKAWAELLHELGFEGESGSASFKDDIDSVVSALHHVLAGGTASITLGGTPSQSVIDDLDTLRRDAVTAHNELQGEDPEGTILIV